MSTQLLATKLYIPAPQPALVRRPRLVAQLQNGLHRKLTLISAPAGFGKTTLISSWVSDSRSSALDAAPEGMGDGNGEIQRTKIQDRVAWLSLSKDEGDPNRFLAYLIGALQRPALRSAVGQPFDPGKELLDALHAPQPTPIDSILTALLNEIATLSDNLILVLDDYHLVDSREVDSALTFLIDHMPPQFHLIITTREDPNLPLARLRAQGQLTEIRAEDLRFTTNESAAFLNQMTDFNLNAAEIAVLEARTEGWIAGLQLAALSMQGRSADAHARAAFIHSFSGSHRFVMDYLLEEVLAQQPPHVQSFLLRTSILDRLCGPLCDAVMDSPVTSGQETLRRLEQANLFLIPLDDERNWYRYHHLFADLLQQRLQQTLANPVIGGPASKKRQDDMTAIHRRASIWFEENQLTLEALHHALAAEDDERAAALLERTWRVMDDNRQSARWLRWAQQLPAEMIRCRPVLAAGYAWALLESGELEDANAWLCDLEQRLEAKERHGHASNDAMVVTEEEEFLSLPATIAAARTYHALARGDLSGTKKYAQRTLDLLPVDSHLRRGVPATLLGLAYWTSGDLELAYRTFADGVASFRMAGNIRFAITGSYILAIIRTVQGRLYDARQIYQKSLRLVAEQGELVQRGSADLYTGLSELACEQGDLETAAAHLQKSRELGGQSPLPRWRYRWSLAQARLKAAHGELDAALDFLDEAEREYVRGPVPDVRPLGARKAQIWVTQGRLAAATEWAQHAALSADDEASYIREFEHVILARLLIARYRREEKNRLIRDAMALLTRLLTAADAGGRTGSVIEILMLQALAYEAQDDLASALTPLARALALAEPEGYVRLFVDEGCPMMRLLSEVATRGSIPAYIDRLLATFSVVVTTSPAQSQFPKSEMVEPLSERELEVLHLIAQGLSNREISERLYIALSTVKGHNRVIFGKLQVQRRTEAVARARALGLV